jgi:hypothetical protein
MRRAISIEENSGTTRFQVEAPALSYLELLQADDFEVKHCAVKVEPMAQVSWADARPMCDRLKDVSDLAILLEAHRRGYAVARKLLET